jgi:diguanylate cyclase (GGDEF)-like protein/PAS domain S-box-containing protein
MDKRDEYAVDWRVKLLERLNVAVRASGVGIWEWDVHTSSLTWDARMYELYDLASETPLTLEVFFRKIHPRDRQRVAMELEHASRDGGAMDSDFRIRTAGGQRWVRATADFISDGHGRPPRMVGACWDITASYDIADQLHEGREQLEITLASISDAVVTTDAAARITFLNAAAEILTGCKADEVAGLPVGDVLDLREPDGDKRVLGFVEQCLKAGTVGSRLDARLVARRGRIYEVEATASSVRTRRGDVIGAVAVLRDMTAAKLLERELRWAATHDTLTGLANRKELERALSKAAADSRETGRRHVLGYLDIDQFKIINDSAGHGAGDLFLRQIAGAFQQMLRPEDILARMGGDEFAVILFDEDLETATRRSEQIIAVVANFRFAWQDRVYSTGVSIGLCAIDPATPPAELLSQADVACYTAKSSGRARVAVYHPDAGTVTKRHQEINLVAGMREVLNEGRLVLHAQPIVPAAGPPGIRHYELLVRMMGRDGSLIAPAAFIPAAERFDLMGDIDRWVIGEALERLGPQIAQNPSLRLSINLSGNTINNPALMEWILQAIALSPVNASALSFEITETAVLNHLVAASAFMDRLRKTGCRIAMDDFGAGLSSFNYLKQFPVDVVKIDGSFIRNIVESEVDRAIVESMNALAHRLGAQTVAEFVENPAIAEVVRAIGVDYLQGNAIGEPVAFEGVLDALTACGGQSAA